MLFFASNQKPMNVPAAAAAAAAVMLVFCFVLQDCTDNCILPSETMKIKLFNNN